MSQDFQLGDEIQASDPRHGKLPVRGMITAMLPVKNGSHQARITVQGSVYPTAQIWVDLQYAVKLHPAVALSVLPSGDVTLPGTSASVSVLDQSAVVTDSAQELPVAESPGLRDEELDEAEQEEKKPKKK